jgi:hypothetical protein
MLKIISETILAQKQWTFPELHIMLDNVFSLVGHPQGPFVRTSHVFMYTMHILAYSNAQSPTATEKFNIDIKCALRDSRKEIIAKVRVNHLRQEGGIKDLSWPANPKDMIFPTSGIIVDGTVPLGIVRYSYGIVDKLEEILEHAEAIGT